MRDRLSKTAIPFLTGTLLCLALAGGGPSRAEGNSSDSVAQGREALGAGRLEEALELFKTAHKNTDDRDTHARLEFYMGVAYQQLALEESKAEEPSSTRARAYLRRAERMYQGYLEAHPDSGAAANNLAKVYRAMGDPQRSSEYYRRAIAVDDGNQGLYLKNYAEMLDEADEWKEASAIYSRMIEEQPLSPSLQKSMATTYASRGLDELAGYLWELLENGYSRQAAERALDALAHSEEPSKEAVGELMAIVAQGLSATSYEPASFEESLFGQRVAEDLVGQDVAGPLARNLLALHQGKDLEPRTYRWWVTYYDRKKDPERGVWAADAFRTLARSLGTHYKNHYDFATAEAYYTLAAELLPQEVDPAAVGALVRMYIQQNKIDKVHGTLETYERTLFQDKGAAYEDMRESELAQGLVAESTYRDSRVRKTYEYHRTLGEIYAAIGQWGDSSRVDSAVFQLEQALRQSRTLEKRAGEELPERYKATPEMVNLLARAYVATNQVDKSVRVRGEAAEVYRARGDDAAVVKVTQQLEVKQLTPVVKRDLKELNSGAFVMKDDGDGPR